MTYNLLTDTDSYKYSHYLQYPPGTTLMSAYISARKGETVFFGLQGILNEHFNKPITQDDVDELKTLADHGLPINIEGFQRIVDQHWGRLPILISALPEGTIVPEGVPMIQIVNTDPTMPWLTSFVETALLRVWYPTTVATRSYNIRKVIRDYMRLTSDEIGDAELFKLHDFGSRGVSSPESAAIGGCAHLTCFRGTDTVQALMYARRHYGEPMAGYSIPGAEHSTITSWGREGEVDAYRNMIQRFAKPHSIFAVVSDSYDLYNAIDNIWGKTLLDEVKATGATLVVRPDSGDPTVVPVAAVARLAETFGFTVNSKGYKVLDKSVRVIQGDGINERSIDDILGHLKVRGFSADNIAFGMGGELLQNLTRDTHSFAMKASARQDSKGAWHDVYKDPATDRRKGSLKARQAVIMQDGKLMAIPRLDLHDVNANLLRAVWARGPVGPGVTLADVRLRIDQSLWSRDDMAEAA